MAFSRAADFSSAIRKRALELGLCRCACSRTKTPRHAEFVRRWLTAGCAGNMGYIERGLAKRLDPSLVLAGAQSVVSVAYPYAPTPAPRRGGDWRQQLRGRIAAYALGTDYHRILSAKIEALAAAIRALAPQCRTLTYVDTGPVLEREWAYAGGIGWFGKNTMLIQPRSGSWFFVGEVLSDLELEPDAPMRDRCGRCRRCIDVCPTGALDDGYWLDARRCISYLTIEHRGVIPRALRPAMANWIFGCDLCQEACPWNDTEAEVTPAAATLAPYLPALLELTEESFRARFKDSAVRRARRTGLLRNAAVALGNTGNPAALPILAAVLSRDPSPLVRAHAAWAIAALPTRAGRPVLERAWRHDPDPLVCDEARCGLSAEPSAS